MCFEIFRMTSSNKTTNTIEEYPFPAVLVDIEETGFRFSDVNELFAQLSSLSKEDINGCDLSELAFFSGNEGGVAISRKLEQALQQALESKRPQKIYLSSPEEDSTAKTNHGKVWLVEVSPLSSSDQQPSVLLSLHDISGLREQKKICNQLLSGADQKATRQGLKHEIQRADAQFKALTEEMNNFLYSVSHDLRAPLRRIDGFSQELMNEYTEQLDETGVHYLQRIRQGAQDMGMLIDELLKLSRLSRRKVSRQQIDIGAIAEEVFSELQEFENDRNVSIQIEEDLIADADPGLVKILWTNLLSNALKFTKNEEKAEINIGQTEREEKKVFYVKDNGAGFDSAHSDKLFKAFSRLHSQKVYTGSGIGLATVKRIIALHGGHIWGEGQTGEGAAFYFNFE